MGQGSTVYMVKFNKVDITLINKKLEDRDVVRDDVYRVK